MNSEKALFQKLYDKAEIILEIGFCYTKIGFQSDMLPRRILQTQFSIYPYISQLLKLRSDVRPVDGNRLLQDVYDFELKMEEYLHFIFDQEVAINLRERQLYLVYNYYQQDTIVNTIAKILYKKFEVSRITFLVANPLPLYLTGLYSGIVIDGGFLQTTMSPIFEGYSLLHLGGTLGYGGLDISVALLKEILAENPQVTRQPAFVMTIQSPEWLEEVKVRIGRILPLFATTEKLQAAKIQIPIYSSNYVTLSYHAVASAFTNTLFGNVEEEHPNLAYNFLRIVRELHHIEVATKLLKNIIFTGGLSLVPNFVGRFRDEVTYFLGTEFKDLQQLCSTMSVTQSQNNPHHLNWLGATIVAQTQLV